MEHVFMAYMSFCQTAIDQLERDMLEMTGVELEDTADNIYALRAHMAFTKNFLKAFQAG